MKFTIAFLICCFAFGASLSAQMPGKQDYHERCVRIKENIRQVFYDSAKGYYKEFTKRDSTDKNEWSYLWPLCGLIQAANEWDALEKNGSYFSTVLKQIQPYYDVAPPAPGYNSYLLTGKKEERYYDDNQWVGIAAIDAYQRTKKTAYLQKADEIYRFMMTGFDTAGGGGLYWREGSLSTKNTCSNGPGVVLALQLYKATKQQHYLDTALLLYNWTNSRLLAPEGVYYDNIRLPSGRIDKHFYTYNAGTMLQSAVLLYEISKDKKYLKEANKIAESAYNIFYKDGRWPGNYWFNAVLLRGYVALLPYNNDRKYLDAFVNDSNAIWEKEADSNKLVGKKEKKNLLDQSALLEMYARLAKYNGERK